MPSKRKTHSFSFKLEVISRLRNGKEPILAVAKELGMPESTIRGWLKNEDKIKSFIEDVGLSRKRVRHSNDPALDIALYKAFCTKKAEGAPLSIHILQTMASHISQKIHGLSSPPSISRSWIDRWKIRHSIKLSQSSITAAAEAFLPQLRIMVETEQLVADQIWNAKETSLNWYVTPDHTLESHADATGANEHKEAREGVTVLLACNWLGKHKLRPLIIATSQSPRCFHHLNKEAPVIYCQSQYTSMTPAIFEDWFHHHFVPGARCYLQHQGLEERGILLLEDCPAHPPIENLVSPDGKFWAMYLPKNDTSRIQPLEQGIISIVKRQYYDDFSQAIAVDFLNEITIKDTCCHIATSWDKVTADFINTIWYRTLGNPFIQPCEDEENNNIFDLTAENLKEDIEGGDIKDLLDVVTKVSPAHSAANYVQEASADPKPNIFDLNAENVEEDIEGGDIKDLLDAVTSASFPQSPAVIKLEPEETESVCNAHAFKFEEDVQNKVTWNSIQGKPFNHPYPDDAQDFAGLMAEDVKAAKAKVAGEGDIKHLLDVVTKVSPAHSAANYVQEASADPKPNIFDLNAENVEEDIEGGDIKDLLDAVTSASPPQSSAVIKIEPEETESVCNAHAFKFEEDVQNKVTWDSIQGKPFNHPYPDDAQDFVGLMAEDVKAAKAKVAGEGDIRHLLDVVIKVSPAQSAANFVQEASADPKPKDPEKTKSRAQHVSHAQALEFAEGLKTYYEQQENEFMVAELTTTIEEIKTLIISRKQKTMLDFFKRA